MKSAFRLTLAALALPLALTACDSDDAATGTVAASEPLAAVPAPAGTQWTQVAETTPEGGVRVGNPDAPLKLVEYASHTCPHCADFSKEAGATLDGYIDKGIMSVELRNQIHDVIDLTFATLARCGEPTAFQPLAKQGWADLNAIFDRAQQNQNGMNAAMAVTDDTRFQRIGEATGLIDWFAARGISRDQAMQCLNGTETPVAIAERSEQQSEELGVTGTPTFFLNGTKLDAQSWSALQPELERAGAR